MASTERKPEPTASSEETAQDYQENAGAGEKDPLLDSDNYYYEGMKVTPPDKREQLPKALIHVGIAVVVLGAALFFYLKKVERDEHVHELAVEARSLYQRDNYRDLQRADSLLEEALDLNRRHEFSIATRGLINSYIWHDHGVEEKRALAEEFTQLAADRQAHLQERYGAAGILLLGTGNAVEAERLLIEDVINEGGTGPAIHGTLGVAQRLLGKTSEARGAFTRASELARRTPRFHYWVAQMYFDGEQFGSASNFIERALDINPDHIHTLILRSRNDIAQGQDLERAHETLTQILERSDRELSPRAKALAIVGLAEHHNAEERREETIATADEALQIISDLPEARIIRGIAMLETDFDAAITEMREGFDAFPYVPRAYHHAAKALNESEMHDEAVAIMDLWGQNVTRTADYYLAYGNIMLDQEKVEEATAHYERAVEIRPRTAEAHYHLGLIAMANEDLGAERIETAVEHFEQALRARDRYPEVYETIGWIYMEQRSFGDALRQFVQAITFYQETGADSEQLNELREEVGRALMQMRQRRIARAWLDESEALVR